MANSAALLAGTATVVSRNSYENYSSGDQGKSITAVVNECFEPEIKLSVISLQS